MMNYRNKSSKPFDKRMDSRHSPGAAGEGMNIIPPHECPDSKRVFPFLQTPSGNLKVLPNQVVYESKKVSVLVADPKHTKINIKSEAENTSKGTFKDGSLPLQYCLKFSPGNDEREIIETSGCQSNRSNYDDDYEPSQLKKEYSLLKLSATSLPIVDWNKILLPFKTELFARLLHRITNYVNPDVEILISNEVFSCHLLVLQCYSEYFEQTKQASKVRLPEDSVTPRSFAIIYKWMIYPGSDSYRLLSRENILEVFMASQYLLIKELEEQCWTFINSDHIFSEETAFLLYMRAKEMNNISITQLMIPRIMRFFLKLVGTTNFVELDFEDISLILRSNFIAVHNEIEVFMSAVRWLMHDWTKRKEYISDLMKCVRFGWIAPWQLVDIRRNPENPEFIRVTSFTDVQQLIEDGLSYAIIKYWYGNQTQDYYHWIDILGLQEPTQRNWIDKEKNYVTYREFLNDLELYQQSGVFDTMQLRSQQPNLNNEDFPPPPTVAEYMAQRIKKSEVENDLENQSNIEGHGESEVEPLRSEHNLKISEDELKTLFHYSDLDNFSHLENISEAKINQNSNATLVYRDLEIPEENKKCITASKSYINNNSEHLGCISPSKSDPLPLTNKGFHEIQEQRKPFGLNNVNICHEFNFTEGKKDQFKTKDSATFENELQRKKEVFDKKFCKIEYEDFLSHQMKNVSRLPEYMSVKPSSSILVNSK